MRHWLKCLNILGSKPEGQAGKTGRWGERKAIHFLRKEKRFRIICQNWKRGFREIDIVAWDGPVMVFVEVRARSASALVSGYDSINAKKKAALFRVCKDYMRALKRPPKHFRFDIVEVCFDSPVKVAINHYENVTLFGKDYRPQYA